ncbi:MAG: hypothetical protein CL694_12010 [Chloroflexi bacterium]|jgi:hypothetical protein|nr:hypothetical protein [Chloroflexota bacterium]MDP6800509.1 hypothetical protein [SAR202 cluster bacterium]
MTRSTEPSGAHTESATEDFVCRAFRLDADGSWTCIRLVAIPIGSRSMQVLPGTKFVRGVRFMGVDIAAWLDRTCT